MLQLIAVFRYNGLKRVTQQSACSYITCHCSVVYVIRSQITNMPDMGHYRRAHALYTDPGTGARGVLSLGGSLFHDEAHFFDIGGEVWTSLGPGSGVPTWGGQMFKGGLHD